MMKRIVRNGLIALAMSVFANFVYSLLQAAPTSLILALTVFMITILLLTFLPEGVILRGLEKLMFRVRLIIPTFSKYPVPFSQIFDFNSEQVRLIYTCRSRLDKVACPQYGLDDSHQLKHVVSSHIPVDEFLTVQLILRWYKDQIRGREREGLIKQFTCTHLLDKFGDISKEVDLWNRAELPDFMYENLIIVGENSCSKLILDRMKSVLNFFPRFSNISAYPSGSNQRPKIDMVFLDSKNNSMKEEEIPQLRTNFDKRTENAVAAIYYLPNPFNVRKSVLILYGCHRVGQYLLEDWLYSPQSALLSRKLAKSLATTSNFGQIVLNGSYTQISEDYSFKRIRMFKNTSTNLPFFPLNVPSNRSPFNKTKADPRVLNEGKMVDISLIVEVNRNDSQLADAIENFFDQNLEFTKEHYKESTVKDIGLHVTLYEFATYETHEMLEEGIKQFDTLRQSFKLALTRKPQLSLIGCEVFSSSIIIYADLSTDFLDSIIEMCRDISPENRYFNRRRVPFPLHCTVIRFKKELSEYSRKQLQSFAESHRKYTFGEISVQTLSLVLAKKHPYQDVEEDFHFNLNIDKS
jgi:hypothetical protein